jgi:hypothetical protein
MIDDSLPTTATVDLALLDSGLRRTALGAYSVANITRSSGGVVLSAKTIRQKKINGLATPFSGRQACYNMCEAQRHRKKQFHGQC